MRLLSSGSLLGVLTQKDPHQENPSAEDLYRVGTVAKIVKFSKNSEGFYNVIIEGITRFEVEEFESEDPFFSALVRPPQQDPENTEPNPDIPLLFETLQNTAYDICLSLPEIPSSVKGFIETIKDPGTLADIIASNLGESAKEKQRVLETYDIADRIIRAMELLGRKYEMLVLSDKINNTVKEEISRNQREYYLRQQLKAINQELGDAAEENDELNILKEKMKTIDLPDEVVKILTKEIKKMRNMQPSQAEYNVSLSYVDTLLEFPWDSYTRDDLNIDNVQKQLDMDHHGLEKVKERIVEYLSVRRLKDDMKGPILCLVGPPGVGKTSLGKSIAHALGRKINRISLGGISDEAEIRGHRRTYIGAMPGKIAKAFIKLGG